jgi:hypothetical protein
LNEEGTKVVAQGKIEIRKAHNNVVDEIRRIFGGAVMVSSPLI